MKATRLAAMLLSALLAQGVPVRGAAQQAQSTQSVTVPVYKPPLRGAPGGRVGGGTRGLPRDMFVLSALAPDHSGLTTQEQPALFWFISAQTSFPVELTISDPRAPRPLVEKRLPTPVGPGVHAIRLADHGVRLTPGVQYRWFVSVVPDPKRRSRDILAGGTVERVEASEELRTRVGQTPREALPFLYAEAGIWYDALASISELIERAPENRDLRRQRAALLAQVGLPPVEEAGEEKPTERR